MVRSDLSHCGRGDSNPLGVKSPEDFIADAAVSPLGPTERQLLSPWLRCDVADCYIIKLLGCIILTLLHPEFLCYKERLQSLERQPHQQTTKEDFASQGFFYCTESNEMICAFCGIKQSPSLCSCSHQPGCHLQQLLLRLTANQPSTNAQVSEAKSILRQIIERLEAIRSDARDQAECLRIAAEQLLGQQTNIDFQQLVQQHRVYSNLKVPFVIDYLKSFVTPV